MINPVLGGNVSDLIMGATKPKTMGATKPPLTSVELENEFMARYKRATGQDLYPQYRDVIVDDKGTKQRGLAYLIDGKPYAPIAHGLDFPFQKSELLAQIPSLNSVKMGHFRSGSQGQEDGVPEDAEASMPDGITGTYQGGGAGGSNPVMNLLGAISKPNPKINDDGSIGYQQPPMFVDSLRDPKDPLAPLPVPKAVTAPQTLPMPTADLGSPTAMPNVDMMPNLLGVAGATTPAVPLPPTTAPPIQGNGNPGTGTTAPVDQAVATTPASWIVLDKDGNIDPEQSQNARIQMELKRREGVANPNALREANATDKRSVLNPELGGAGLLALLGTTLLAGQQGASIVKGAVGGIQDATARRQARSDIDFQARQNERETKARAIENDTKNQEGQFAKDMLLLTGLRSSDQKEASAAQKALNDQLNRDLKTKANQDKQDRYLKIGDERFWAGMTQQKSGELRELYARNSGKPFTEEEFASFRNMTPQEAYQQQLTSASSEKVKRDNEMAPLLRNIAEARANGIWAGVGLADVRAKGIELDNDIKEINIKYLPQKLKSEIANTAARTKSILDRADLLTKAKDTGQISMGLYVKEMTKNGSAKLQADAAFKKYESLEASLTVGIKDLDDQIKVVPENDPGLRSTLISEKSKLLMAKVNATAQKDAAKVSADGYEMQEQMIEKMKPKLEQMKREGRDWLSKNKGHAQYKAAYDLFVREFGENP